MNSFLDFINRIKLDLEEKEELQEQKPISKSLNEKVGILPNVNTFDINKASRLNSMNKCAICERPLTGKGTTVFTDGSEVSDEESYFTQGCADIKIGSECLKKLQMK